MQIHFSFKQKTSLGFGLISLVSMSAAGLLSYFLASNLLEELVISGLKGQISGAESAIHVSVSENSVRLSTLMDHWAPKIGKELSFDFSSAQSRRIENQVTHEKFEAKVPVTLLEGKPLDGHRLVDQVFENSTSAATIFANIPQGLVRISTSLKKADGNRPIDTLIPVGSTIYETLSQGKRFVGRARVLGQWYVTAYEPILRGKEMVGAFFLGTPETSLTMIKDYLKNKKLLETGYFFIFDGAGTFVLHPTMEGKDSSEIRDLDGKSIFKAALGQESGLMKYRWQNAETHQPQNKLAFFRYFPEVDWYVAGVLDEAEAQAPLFRLKNLLLLITFSMTTVVALVAVIYSGKISKVFEAVSMRLASAAGSINTASTELAGASAGLSSGASQAASSLEETVSALEELSSMVKLSADHAREASALSQSSQISAEKGEAEVNQLIRAMLEISQSSKKMVEIIDVIEDIAFQTDLLALNAAVEAARAG